MTRTALPLLAAIAAILAVPVAAQDKAQDDSTLKQAANKVTEPFDGKEVPDKLKAVQDDSYSLAGMRRCAAISAEIQELDAVLGPEVNAHVDKDAGKKRKQTAGRLAGIAGKSLIPFAGLVGEVTGASAERRRYAVAVYAGAARRGFLKGVGLTRGCKAPARP